MKYSQKQVNNLNKDIRTHFPHLFEIKPSYKTAYTGVSRMVMLDRYAQKDKQLKTLKAGDLVVTMIKPDPKFPTRGIGYVKSISEHKIKILIDEEYTGAITPDEKTFGPKKNIIERDKHMVEKPMEIYYEQIARRVGFALSACELTPQSQEKYGEIFAEELGKLNIIPAGRVLYGAGSGTKVTYFNCFVMPFVKDSREGISEHRKEVMEIMSRGGGVGTNGSTLRPRGAVAKGVGGKSSGSVSWLNDLANLTHLVEQGGSRRGAQMIMLADWHPDIIQFIISKMQNPRILRWLIENSKDEEIIAEAKSKIKFVSLSAEEIKTYETILDFAKEHPSRIDRAVLENAHKQLNDKGQWKVINEDFLTGANISVTISDDFIDAVKKDKTWDLRFPDLVGYTPEEKKIYDAEWHVCGDVKEWESLGRKTKVYRKIKARELWDLINFCATYSAEPGIFFIERANKMTNAKAYGQKVVATNPCGEQPLAPYSVCNLSAINLANFVDKKTKKILYEKLANTVKVCTRMQDNVIDSTPYFIEANKLQALGERRVGLGIMGLHDLLIYANIRYGSDKGNAVVDKVMQTIAIAAYKESIELAKKKGSFPFLKDREAFINTGFMKTMPQEIRSAILKYGIRNSHLLTIAPTGSTGTMVGVSTGLEPYFAFKYYRSGRLGKFMEVDAGIVETWRKYNPKYKNKNIPLPTNIFAAAMELTPEDHADLQCIIQRWVDSSISKTVNAPKGYSVREVEKIYMRLFDKGAKGGTVYVDGSRDAQVLSLTNNENEFASDSSHQLSIEGITPVEDSIKKDVIDPTLRADRQGREVGVEIGDICPICKEGTVIESGGCNTCTNCGAQLKCGL